MMIPGGNLLNVALGVIAKQTVVRKSIVSQTTNGMGYTVPVYSSGEEIQGSFQPVPRSAYQMNGLDFEKTYANFYTPNNVTDLLRGATGDILEYNGQRWQVMPSNDWFAQDGWTGVLCVAIGPIPSGG